jgi:hypothetical protein
MTPEEERSGDLRDVALANEIELVSDLVVAASSSARHFTPDEVDELLGVSGEASDSAEGAESAESAARADDAAPGDRAPSEDAPR